MKKINILLILMLTVVFYSCEYDNYDPPSIKLSGKLICNGGDYYYDGNPDFKNMGLIRVYQKGFGKIDNGIPVRVDESGNFAQMLFAGEYWMTLDNKLYPFEITEFKPLPGGQGYDSIYIDLRSNLHKEFEITPYYDLTDFTVTIENGNIVMRANVTKNPKIEGDVPNVAFARGYVGTASLVNSSSICTRSTRATITTGSGSVEVSVPLTGTAASYREVYVNNFRDYAFCRLAIELTDIPNHYLFTETVKIEGVPME